MHAVFSREGQRRLAGIRPVLGGLAWSVAVAILFLGVAIASSIGGHMVGQATVPWAGPVAMGLVAIGGSALVTWVARVKLNRRTWGAMGLPWLQSGRLALGAGCGMLAVLAMAALEHGLGWIHLASAPSEGTGSRYLLATAALVSSLGVGFSEELVFRGYVFGTLAERMAPAPAVLVTGLLFGLIHFTVDGFGTLFVVSVVLYSTMFLAMRFATGSLWFPIGFHALYDWTQTYLVGLSTSGSAHDPALVPIVQTGPGVWVGHAPAIESGVLFMGMAAVVAGTASLGGRLLGRAPCAPK